MFPPAARKPAVQDDELADVESHETAAMCHSVFQLHQVIQSQSFYFADVDRVAASSSQCRGQRQMCILVNQQVDVRGQQTGCSISFFACLFQ